MSTQPSLVSRPRTFAAGRRFGGRHRLFAAPLLVVCLSLAVVGSVSTAGRRIYSDDPISREPESQDASAAQLEDIGLFYEITYNLFVTSRYVPSNTRARNINTIDEVADSSWFTNRIGATTLTAAEVERGPVMGSAPTPERWTIIREKSAGANPGFTAKDANGETWFLGFDPPSNPEGATAAVVVASKLFWAIGYNQVEMFITTFDPKKVVFDPGATKKRPSGARTPFTTDDMNAVLEGVARNKDGTYRVAAGRLLPGKVIGSFRYSGTRPDDPNDVVPHEHRRELRALRVFGAWTNLTDLKAGNTLDTLITENGKGIIKHVLQDVGSTFGMANGEHEWDIGWEHFYQGDATRRRLMSFGFALSPWQTVPYKEEYPSIHRFEGERFDPREWRPQTPTAAYMEMRADDAFWAARRVMSFNDDLIRAAVRAGQYSDPAAARHLATVIGERRDKIGRVYLTAVNPIVDPRLDASGSLTFENAAVAAGLAKDPTTYRATWSRFDNATGNNSPIGETQSTSTTMAAPRDLPSAPEGFIEVDLTAENAQFPSWRQPVRTYFRRTAGGWKLVGLERLPERLEGPAAEPAKSSKSK
jgi:hypothetical protein